MSGSTNQKELGSKGNRGSPKKRPGSCPSSEVLTSPITDTPRKKGSLLHTASRTGNKSRADVELSSTKHSKSGKELFAKDITGRNDASQVQLSLPNIQTSPRISPVQKTQSQLAGLPSKRTRSPHEKSTSPDQYTFDESPSKRNRLVSLKQITPKDRSLLATSPPTTIQSPVSSPSTSKRSFESSPYASKRSLGSSPPVTKRSVSSSSTVVKSPLPKSPSSTVRSTVSSSPSTTKKSPVSPSAIKRSPVSPSTIKRSPVSSSTIKRSPVSPSTTIRSQPSFSTKSSLSAIVRSPASNSPSSTVKSEVLSPSAAVSSTEVLSSSAAVSSPEVSSPSAAVSSPEVSSPSAAVSSPEVSSPSAAVRSASSVPSAIVGPPVSTTLSSTVQFLSKDTPEGSSRVQSPTQKIKSSLQVSPVQKTSPPSGLSTKRTRSPEKISTSAKVYIKQSPSKRNRSAQLKQTPENVVCPLATLPSASVRSPESTSPPVNVQSPLATSSSTLDQYPLAKTPSPLDQYPLAKTPSPLDQYPLAKTPSPLDQYPLAKTPSPLVQYPTTTSSPLAISSPENRKISFTKTPSPLARYKRKSSSPRKRSPLATPPFERVPSPLASSPSEKVQSPQPPPTIKTATDACCQVNLCCNSDTIMELAPESPRLERSFPDSHSSVNECVIGSDGSVSLSQKIQKNLDSASTFTAKKSNDESERVAAQKLVVTDEEPNRPNERLPEEIVPELCEQPVNTQRGLPFSREMADWAADMLEKSDKYPKAVQRFLKDRLEFLRQPLLFEKDKAVSFLGMGSCGKTSLILKMLNKSDEYFKLRTTPLEYSFVMQFEDETPIMDVVFKDSNISCMESRWKNNYRQSELLILCFAVNDIDSYLKVTGELRQEILRSYPSAPMMLVGLKSDLRNKANIPAIENTFVDKDFIKGTCTAQQFISYSECSIYDESCTELYWSISRFLRNLKNKS